MKTVRGSVFSYPVPKAYHVHLHYKVYQFNLQDLTSLSSYQSSPPPLSAKGRTEDIDAILSVIDDAKKFVYISVMDYTPTEEFSEPRR